MFAARINPASAAGEEKSDDVLPQGKSFLAAIDRVGSRKSLLAAIDQVGSTVEHVTTTGAVALVSELKREQDEQDEEEKVKPKLRCRVEFSLHILVTVTSIAIFLAIPLYFVNDSIRGTYLTGPA